MNDEKARAAQLVDWSFYDTATGVFSTRTFTGNRGSLRNNTPKGCAALEGRYDRLSQRVNVETGEVVAYDSPERDAVAQESRQRAAKARIEELERAQLRPLRELVLNGDEKARDRLAEIDGEIAAARADLAG